MTKDELRQEIENLPPLPNEAPVFTWLHRRIALRRHIREEDPNDLLKWSTIQATMITTPDYHDYHLDRWEEETGIRINALTSIVEFGGGYGAMVEACYRRGFAGEYYSFDFPEMLLLQEFYLTLKGIKPPILNSPGHCDLFIAICSLSEADPETREQFLSGLVFNHCLVRYSELWDDIDNYRFFRKFDGHHYKIDDPRVTHWLWVK